MAYALVALGVLVLLLGNSVSRRRELARQGRKPFPHGGHLVMTVLTLGVWLPIWILHRLISQR